eukprot:COSAG02_NODE_14313_length_1285_cov_6.364884_1_plen_23_part_01
MTGERLRGDGEGWFWGRRMIGEG